GETIVQSGLTVTTYTDTGRTNGTTYFYEVTASNVGGESAKSSEASATPQGPPSAPTGLTATAGNAQVSLSWNSVTGATSYSVYRSTTSGGETLVQSGLTVTTYSDTGRTNGTTYFYEVTASNVGGESAKSAEASATPQAPPVAPTGLTATAGNAQVSLSWNSVTGATSYSVYRSTTSGAETLVQAGLTVTTYTDTGRTNGTTYFYEVTASNVGGESAKSSEASATPQAPPAGSLQFTLASFSVAENGGQAGISG